MDRPVILAPFAPFSAPLTRFASSRNLPLWTLSRMVVLRSSRGAAHSLSPTRSSVCAWKTMIRFSQKNSICSSRSARTRTSTGQASTARHSLAKRSTLVRCKIRCRFGSASAAPPNHSLAPVCTGFPSWSRSSVANPNDSALSLISIARQAAAPVTPPTNSSWDFTPSAFWETRPSKLRTIFILGMPTRSPRLASSAAGLQLPEHNSTPCADPLGRC